MCREERLRGQQRKAAPKVNGSPSTTLTPFATLGMTTARLALRDI